MAHKKLHDLVFQAGQRNGLTTAAQDGLLLLQRDIAQHKLIWDKSIPAAQKCPNASQQFLHGKGLGQAIIRAGVQPLNPILGAALSTAKPER